MGQICMEWMALLGERWWNMAFMVIYISMIGKALLGKTPRWVMARSLYRPLVAWWAACGLTLLTVAMSGSGVLQNLAAIILIEVILYHKVKEEIA